MGQFKFVAQKMGTGWISLHVAVDEYYNWQDTRDEICLTLDADGPEDVCANIDALIVELNKLKQTARRKYAGWNAANHTKNKE